MEKVAAGIHRVSKGVNAFIVDGDDGVTLIDTGLPQRHGAIVAGLETIGRSAADVRAIVLTHAHVDHVGGAASLKRETGAPLFASAIDAPAIRGEVEKPPPPVFDRVPFLKPLFRLLPDSEAVDVDHEIDGSNRGSLPSDLRVLNTPGHTPGHVSYLLDRHGGVLFVGDAALGSKNGTVKRGFMNRSTPMLDASIAHIAEHDFEIACFGHSAPILSSAAGSFRSLAASF